MSLIKEMKNTVTEEPAYINSVIEACKKGDPAAQFNLYKQYSKAMFNLAWRMVNNREDAEDMLQDSFADAFRKIGTYRYESTFGAWLKTIVINKCINHLRSKKMEIVTDNLPENGMHDEERDEEKIKYEAEKVSRAIDVLPNGYRIILTLYLLEGFDHKEIAQILKISESTSKTQYMRAKMKLKKTLLED